MHMPHKTEPPNGIPEQHWRAVQVCFPPPALEVLTRAHMHLHYRHLRLVQQQSLPECSGCNGTKSSAHSCDIQTMEEPNEEHLLLWFHRKDRSSMKTILRSHSTTSQWKCELFYPLFELTTISLLLLPFLPSMGSNPPLHCTPFPILLILHSLFSRLNHKAWRHSIRQLYLATIQREAIWRKSICVKYQWRPVVKCSPNITLKAIYCITGSL